MLESRSEDALVLLVKLVKSTVMTVETVETVETVVTVETVETAETVLTEDLKKYDSLTDSLTDNLKARDASASKKAKSFETEKFRNRNVKLCYQMSPYITCLSKCKIELELTFRKKSILHYLKTSPKAKRHKILLL